MFKYVLGGLSAVGATLAASAPAMAVILTMDLTGAQFGVLPSDPTSTTTIFDPSAPNPAPPPTSLPADLPPDLKPGAQIIYFEGNALGGLEVDLLGGGETGEVTHVYLGKEAGYINGAFELIGGGGDQDDQSFDTANGPVGSPVVQTVNSNGMLDFQFTSDDGSAPLGVAQNGGPIGTGMSIGWWNPDLTFGQDNDGNTIVTGGLSSAIWYVLLDDSGANVDKDWDDMVLSMTIGLEAPPVPLPAPILLLLSGLLGLGFLGKFRKQSSVSAS